MRILVLAEQDEHTIQPATLHTLSAAKVLSQLLNNAPITLLIAGFTGGGNDETEANIAAEVKKAASFEGVNEVWWASNACYAKGLAENVAALIAKVACDFDYILAPSTTYGKNILPRAAALLDVTQVSDVMQILSPDTFVRPTYAGNVLSHVRALDKQKVLTIRITAFKPLVETNHTAAPIIELKTVLDTQKARFIRFETIQSSRPELTAARVVIAGGRGLGSLDNFKLLETIADKLNAAIGASRAAVDAGFVPNEYQIGQTGKIVAPDLYIAVGISGAIQHLAGMKESKIIVAINKDPEAPIFQVTDYGLVGDLFEILPALNRALDATRKD